MKFFKIFLLLLAIFIPLFFANYFLKNFLTTSCSFDGLSHLYIAKNVIHNGEYSTIKNLGAVWLPLYHLLLIPFLFFDTLYFSGLAGTFLNTILLLFIILLIFKIFPFPYSLFISLAFIFYPYLIIYTVSPMSELLTIFLLICSFYYFLKDDINKLMITVILGTLTRYEFYLVALFLFFYYFPKKKIFLIFLGILFWLFYNYLLYSDPFYFYNHPVTKNTCGILPYAFNLKNLIKFNLKILKELFSYLPILSFITFFYLIYKKFYRIILLALPLLAHIFLEYFNISLGYSRFYLLSLPFFLFTPFFFIKELKNRKLSLILTFIIFFSFVGNFSAFTVLKTGENHYQNKFPYGHHLDVNYPLVKRKILYFKNLFSGIALENKKILIPSSQEFQIFSFALKIRPENIFDACDKEIINIMLMPEKYCDLLVTENFLDDFSFRFHKFFENNYYCVLFLTDEEYQKKILNNFSFIKGDEKYSLYLKK